MRLYALIYLVCVLIFSLSANAQDKWQSADDAIIRLKPGAFPQLPKGIKKYLQLRGCRIPQSFIDTKPHNVIWGAFIKSGKVDWAVLCSRNLISSILIFPRGSTKGILETAKSPDKDFLQLTGLEKIGFSRKINAVDKAFILNNFREYGSGKPPLIKHQGINDAFVEKASTIHYFNLKKWLRLPGAD